MKIINKMIVFLWVIFFFSWSYGYSQELIVLRSDTIIALSPNNVKTINKILVDYEYTIKKNSLYQEKIQADSVLLGMKDSIITKSTGYLKNYGELMKKKDTDIAKLQEYLEEERLKYRRKNRRILLTSIIGMIGGIILLK